MSEYTGEYWISGSLRISCAVGPGYYHCTVRSNHWSKTSLRSSGYFGIFWKRPIKFIVFESLELFYVWFLSKERRKY